MLLGNSVAVVIADASFCALYLTKAIVELMFFVHLQSLGRVFMQLGNSGVVREVPLTTTKLIYTGPNVRKV